MLVLSRKQQQEIVIGENVKITVLKIKGNTVRLGIEAPRDIKVIRGELPREPQKDEQVANVTVVFNDHVENSRSSRGSEVEVVKFEKSADDSCSISFRQVTPEALKHNRLKKIVEDISKSK